MVHGAHAQNRVIGMELRRFTPKEPEKFRGYYVYSESEGVLLFYIRNDNRDRAFVHLNFRPERLRTYVADSDIISGQIDKINGISGIAPNPRIEYLHADLTKIL